MRRLLVLALVVLPIALAAQSGTAPPQRLEVPYRQFQLANGLNVILHRDTSVPIVAVNVWYHVGSGNERPGRTGFAHLFEHLMFEGSKHVKEGEFDTLLEAAGGNNNGSTSNDRTNYVIDVPSNALDLALFLESDRMAYLLDTMSPERVNGQRDVVKNERRQSYENRPYGMASIELDKMLWPAGHPYSWPTIGHMEDLTAASHDDVVQFFKKYYAPNNASLVIAGDIDFDKTKALVEKWFGELPKGAPVEPVAPPAAMLTEVKRHTMTDRVRLSRLFLGWLTPRVYAPGDAALDVASSVLAGGKNSRLYKRLVYDTQMAQEVSAYQQSGRLGSQFIIDVTARPGRAMAEIQAAVDEELAKMRQEPPSAREMQRALNQIEASFYRGMQRVGSFGGKADKLNSYFFAGGSPDYFAEDLARYTSLSAVDVQAAVSQWLPRDRRVELVVEPEVKKSGGEEVNRRLTAHGSRLTAWTTTAPTTVLAMLVALLLGSAATFTQGKPDRSMAPALGPAPELKIPPIQKRALANGLPVWIVEQHEVPLVQVNLVIHAGSGDDPANEFGLASFTAAMLDEGAGARTALQIADEVEFLGASLGTTSSFDASAIRLNTPVRQLRPALALMADVALRPTFPAAEVERLRQERLTALLQAKDDASSVAPLAFARVVFGQTHRYGTAASGTEGTLKALMAAQMRAFHAARYRPSNATLIVAGDVTATAVLPQLEAAFGDWPMAAPVPRTAVPLARQSTAGQVTIVDMPSAEQSQIRIGWVGVPRSAPDYFPLVVLNTVLGGSFTSRLNQNLREEHGYSYGASSRFDMRLSAGAFQAGAGVQTDKTAEALREFFKEFKGIAAPVSEAELAKAKNYVALSFPSEFETIADLTSHLEEMAVYKLPDTYFSQYVANVQAVTAAAVQKAAATYVQPEKFAVVVVGDRKAIEAGVRALALAPVRTVTVEEAVP